MGGLSNKKRKERMRIRNLKREGHIRSKVNPLPSECPACGKEMKRVWWGRTFECVRCGKRIRAVWEPPKQYNGYGGLPYEFPRQKSSKSAQRRRRGRVSY